MTSLPLLLADLLLVADGLRVSFIVDVFAPLSMWLKLTQQLTEVSPNRLSQLPQLSLARSLMRGCDREWMHSY